MEKEELKEELKELNKLASSMAVMGRDGTDVLVALIHAKAIEKAGVTIAEALDYVAREIKACGENH